MMNLDMFSIGWPLLEAKSFPVLTITVFTVLFFIYRLANRASSRTRSTDDQTCQTSLQNSSPNPSKLNIDRSAEDYSKCSSPGCVRCKNYDRVKENLATKFHDYIQSTEDTEAVDEYQIDNERTFERLKLSIQTTNPKPDQKRLTLEGSQFLQNPAVFQLLGVSSKPWYERTEISEKDVKLIEDSFPIIWEEFAQVYEDFLQGDNAGWLSNSVPTGQWSVFHLYNQGSRVMSNCMRCPGTARTLENLDTFMCDIVFGNATFTVLQAGTHITEHYGPCNLRIRCHLGLQIPPHCSLTVAHQTRQWVEEGCLLFDDSYLHEAKHGGLEEDGPRIVFMVDLWHPGVTEEEKPALKYLFPT